MKDYRKIKDTLEDMHMQEFYYAICRKTTNPIYLTKVHRPQSCLHLVSSGQCSVNYSLHNGAHLFFFFLKKFIFGLYSWVICSPASMPYIDQKFPSLLKMQNILSKALSQLFQILNITPLMLSWEMCHISVLRLSHCSIHLWQKKMSTMHHAIASGNIYILDLPLSTFY